MANEEYLKILKQYQKRSGKAGNNLVHLMRKNYDPLIRTKRYRKLLKLYGGNTVFALTKAEDVWHGIDNCLYGNEKTMHFSKYGEEHHGLARGSSQSNHKLR